MSIIGTIIALSFGVFVGVLVASNSNSLVSFGRRTREKIKFFYQTKIRKP